jgi:hypothetical protein
MLVPGSSAAPFSFSTSVPCERVNDSGGTASRGSGPKRWWRRCVAQRGRRVRGGIPSALCSQFRGGTNYLRGDVNRHFSYLTCNEQKDFKLRFKKQWRRVCSGAIQFAFGFPSCRVICAIRSSPPKSSSTCDRVRSVRSRTDHREHETHMTKTRRRNSRPALSRRRAALAALAWASART